MNGFIVASTVAMAVIAAPTLPPSNTVNTVHNVLSATSLVVALGEQNNSKVTGSAYIADVPGGVRVKIFVKGEPSGASEPAHIHLGTCLKLNPVPWKPLNNVVTGSSITTVPGLTVAQIKRGTYAINVHESALNIEHYVACGDL